MLALTPVTHRRGLVALPAAAEIGTVPLIFNPDMNSYKVKDIAKLMLFYNEDFGIVLNDDEGMRRIKLIEFMTKY